MLKKYHSKISFLYNYLQSLFLCPRCHSTDRGRLIYWCIVNKINILNLDKTINLLHVAPERNLQKILKSFSNIEFVSGDLNSLIKGCR